jgi:hypothetical protein
MITIMAMSVASNVKANAAAYVWLAKLKAICNVINTMQCKVWLAISFILHN